MVLDVGQWDDAEMTNAPGQSGDPRSPFYRNLLQGWAEDSSFPMLYSREGDPRSPFYDNLLEGWATDSSFPLLYSRNAVEANQALRIVLEPAD